MNIERELQETFRRLTPNVLGALPSSETTVKRRKRLSDRAVQMIATAASIALLIGAGLGGAAYFRDRYGWPSFQSGGTTLTNPIGTTGTPTNPTETQKPTEDTVPPITDPVETTKPTEPMPTDPLPTDPQPTDPPEQISDEKYDSCPNSVTVWIYSPDDQWYFDKYELNASECVEEWLYVFNKETGEPTLICDEPVAMFDENYEHIYYVTKQDPTTVIRSDYDGQNKVTFDMGITITYLDYFGGRNGNLVLVDDYTDIIIYDLELGAKNLIFTYHDIVAVSLGSSNPTRIEFDTSTEGYYFCDLETGEMWQEIFEPVPGPTMPTPSIGGTAFVYTGQDPVFWVGGDLTEQCTVGYCYYANENKKELFLVCEEEVIMCCETNYLIFYVKQTEPTKIYATSIENMTEHWLLYESGEVADINQICEIPPHKNRNTAIFAIEGNCRVVWIDVETGESEVLLEKYYIEWAYVGGGSMEMVDGEYVLLEINIAFRGKLHEDDQLGDYIYNHTTGEITAGPEL